MIAAVKGYRVAVTMFESASLEKRRMLESYGVEIFSIPAGKGPDGARDEAMKLFKQYPDKYFLAGQNFNEDNIIAHYETTGKEIWEDTGGEVDYFVAGIGTSGTIIGVGKRLKELKPEVRIIGVEPYPKHKVYGLKNLEESRLPEIYDERYIDETIRVSDEEAIRTTRHLIRKEGIFAGISSGAVMFAALEKIKVLDKGNMVVLFADSGERYLSTGLLTDS
jgi:cysteine synthase